MGSDKAPTLSEAPSSPLVLSPTKNLFIKFMKVFIEMMQTQTQVRAEPQKHPLKARYPETY